MAGSVGSLLLPYLESAAEEDDEDEDEDELPPAPAPAKVKTLLVWPPLGELELGDTGGSAIVLRISAQEAATA